jgi:ABC-type glycerol-3-phosphate transport system permease component
MVSPGSGHALDLIWIVNFLATVFGSFFLLRKALGGVRTDLADAACIDGFGFWRHCWHVMLPRARPALGLLALFIFIAAADDAMAPLIAAGRAPFASGFFALHLSARGVSAGAGSLGLLMAASLLLIAPLIAIFLSAARSLRKADPS